METRVPDRTQRALANTAIQGSGQLVTWVLSWILLVMLPRALGDEGFGRFFLALSYGMLFSTLVNLGINTFVVREVAVLRACSGQTSGKAHGHSALHELLGTVLSLKLVLAIGVYALQALLIFLLPYDPATRQAVLIIGIGTALGAVAQSIGGVFQGFERLLAPNVALVAEKIIITGGCAVLLGLGHGLVAVCWVHTLASAGNLAIQLVWLRRIQPLRLSWRAAMVKRVMLGGLPFLVWVVFGEIYVRIDILMLSLMTSTAVVGWYGAATRLYGALLFIPNILTTAIFPAMMKLGADEAGDGHDFARASERLMHLIIFAAVPVAFGAIAVAQPLIVRLYGPGPFEHAAANLRVLGFAVLLVCVDVVLGTALIARGREKALAAMAVAAAAFNPLVNLVTIPMAMRLWGNGGVGAAVSTVLTELLMMGGALWLMPRGVFSSRMLVTGLKGVALGVAMVLILQGLNTSSLSLLIAAGAGLYLPAAWVTGLMPTGEIRHLWHAARRRGVAGPPAGGRSR